MGGGGLTMEAQLSSSLSGSLVLSHLSISLPDGSSVCGGNFLLTGCKHHLTRVWTLTASPVYHCLTSRITISHSVPTTFDKFSHRSKWFTPNFFNICVCLSNSSQLCRHTETLTFNLFAFPFMDPIPLDSMVIWGRLHKHNPTTGFTEFVFFVDESKTNKKKATGDKLPVSLVQRGNHIQTEKRYNKQNYVRARGKAAGSERRRAEETSHLSRRWSWSVSLRQCEQGWVKQK